MRRLLAVIGCFLMSLSLFAQEDVPIAEVIFDHIGDAYEWHITTIKGFNMILDGQVDYLPEQAFLNVGTIEDAIRKGEAILAKAKE